MTIERGPVVPGSGDALRERLDCVIAAEDLARNGEYTMLTGDLVSAILAEIAAAGFSIVETDRLERLRARAEWSLDPEQYMYGEPIPALQFGDLDD
jgi:hypothetical protein